MCVIIYVPKEANIEEEEIRSAWKTNPDGAGYSIQIDNKVFFKRGFMNIDEFVNEITPYIGTYNLLLHFRISTSNKVNRLQTHPYKKGNVTLTEGVTDKPVICMNGIIYNQKEYKDCNDTMSYIIDHESAFSRINQDILDIIEDSSGAKWAVMKPDEVLTSSKFEKIDGKYYSNTNHLWRKYIKVFKGKTYKKKYFDGLIKGRKLKNSIRKNKNLHLDVLDFINEYCNKDEYGGDSYCDVCTKCLKSCKTLREVKLVLAENALWGELYEEAHPENEIIYIQPNELNESWWYDYYDYDECCTLDNYKNYYD